VGVSGNREQPCFTVERRLPPRMSLLAREVWSVLSRPMWATIFSASVSAAVGSFYCVISAIAAFFAVSRLSAGQPCPYTTRGESWSLVHKE